MSWHVWRKQNDGDLPEAVQTALASQFRLDSEAMSQLRLFEQSGRFAGRPVRFIRLVDSTLLNVEKKAPLKYRSFDDGTYKNALQFEGHIEKEGYVLLHDRRPMRLDPT
jgi:hypothetical protein